MMDEDKYKSLQSIHDKYQQIFLICDPIEYKCRLRNLTMSIASHHSNEYLAESLKRQESANQTPTD